MDKHYLNITSIQDHELIQDKQYHHATKFIDCCSTVMIILSSLKDVTTVHAFMHAILISFVTDINVLHQTLMLSAPHLVVCTLGDFRIFCTLT